MNYAELHSHSNFSFLDGADHPETLAARAGEIGLPALALTDTDNLSGVIRFDRACRQAGVRPVIGAELTTTEGRLLVLAEDSRGWANLSQLVSRGQLSGSKRRPQLDLDSVADYRAGLIVLSGGRDGVLNRQLRSGRRDAALRLGRRLRERFGRAKLWVEIQHHLLPDDQQRIAELADLAGALGLGVVATNAVRYAAPSGWRRQDVLACVRLKIAIDRPHAERLGNAEYFLKTGAVQTASFARWPAAISNTLRIAEQCAVDLDFRSARFPEFPIPGGETPSAVLRRLTYQGAAERFRSVEERHRNQIEHELAVIDRLGLAEYFLIVWDIVRFCRERNILAQGRGSAANSAVCFCLGITAVDPIRLDLLFERFLSEERAGAPDIDIDIANADREQVIQYVYERYGREHAGMVCEYISYRSRSAIRDVAKVLGLTPAQIDALASDVADGGLEDGSGDQPENGGSEKQKEALWNAQGSPSQTPAAESVLLARQIAREIIGFPRHLGIHVGGMVVTRRPLIEIVPVEWATMPGRTVLQWDKDDVEEAGLIKIDLLGLGMLSLLRDCLQLVRDHEGIAYDLALLPTDDPAVYDMLCEADTVGVFQVESRAQMQTLPRLRPRTFYDLVVEVALIRPGPIQGEMVHPYLRRRAGEEAVTYPHPAFEPILRKTLGVPLFQEQGMKLAIAAAGFSAGQADRLRKAMGSKRSRQQMARLKADLLAGMVENGIPAEIGERIFFQLSAFADYGFPESHAASFALLVYASAYLKRYHPAEFVCALLNNQPMGFYQPAVIVGDAKRHGVPVLPVQVNRSKVECTVERDVDGRFVVRVGYRYVRGIGERTHPDLQAAIAAGPFRSFEDFARRTNLERDTLEHLVTVGAFDDFGLPRRELLWRLPRILRQIREGQLAEGPGPDVDLPLPSERDLARTDYRILGLSPTYHPVAFYRDQIAAKGALPAERLSSVPDGRLVRVGGVAVIRQRPSTAKGHVFITLEDETGMANLILRPSAYERYRPVARNAPILLVEGRLQRQHAALSILVSRIWPIGPVERPPIVPPRNFR